MCLLEMAESHSALPKFSSPLFLLFGISTSPLARVADHFLNSLCIEDLLRIDILIKWV